MGPSHSLFQVTGTQSLGRCPPVLSSVISCPSRLHGAACCAPAGHCLDSLCTCSEAHGRLGSCRVERAGPGAGVRGQASSGGSNVWNVPVCSDTQRACPTLASADCETVAAEDGVCGRVLNICRYLNRHHQSSFTAGRCELGSNILKLFVIFFQEIEVLCQILERALWVWE